MIRRRVVADSVVVVVGGTSGAGRATALSLAALGARVVVVSRSPADVAEVAASCMTLGPASIGVAADISVAEDVDRIVKSAVEAFGAIDTWINAASLLIVGELDQQPVDEIERIIATNVFGTALCSQAAVSHFKDRGSGVLINVSSLLALVPNPMVPTYVMTKFAIRGLSLSLHALVPRGPVRVCVVMPGPIDSPMFKRAANHTGRAVRAIPPAFSPERVAATIIRSVKRPRRQRTVGVVGALIVLGEHVVPRFTEAVVASVAARLVFAPRPAPHTAGSLYGDIGLTDADGHPIVGRTDGQYRRFPLRAELGDRVGRFLARRP